MSRKGESNITLDFAEPIETVLGGCKDVDQALLMETEEKGVSLYEGVLNPPELRDLMTVNGDDEVIINGTTIRLTKHNLYVFNALLMHGHLPRIVRKDIVGDDFYPTTSSESVRRNAYQKAVTYVRDQVNEAAGEDIIQRYGVKGGIYYVFAPLWRERLEASDVRNTLTTAPALEARESSKQDSEYIRREKIMTKLAARYAHQGDADRKMQDRLLESKRDLAAPPVSAGKHEQLSRYHQEAVQYRLLTAEEEKLLAQYMDEGIRVYDAMKRGGRVVGEDKIMPTPEEEEILRRLVDARQTLMMCNRRLVLSIARNYFLYASAGMDEWDIVSHGDLGLFRAIPRFDPKKARFSTHASRWIRQAIQWGEAEERGTVNRPANIVRAERKARRFIAEREQAGMPRPTYQEIAKYVDLEPKTVVAMLRFSEPALSSLDAHVGDNEDTTLGELLEDKNDNFETVKDRVGKVVMHDLVRDLLERADLSNQELVVLGLRYPVEDQRIADAKKVFTAEGHNMHLDDIDVEGLTLDAVGKRLKITRERVRQIEKGAFNKMLAVAEIDDLSVIL